MSLSADPHIISSANEHKLASPPSDCVSSVRFGPEGAKFLLVSSWDGTVRLYDTEINAQRTSYSHSGAVLDVAFYDKVRSASGGLDCTAKLFDFNAGAETVIGRHTAPIRCVECPSSSGLIYTGGWDCNVYAWDSRSSSASGHFRQPDKVYSMSTVDSTLLVATAGRKVYIYDIRNMAEPVQRRDSSLKYQTRCIRAFPNKQGYVLSSIEGRVAVEYLDQDAEMQKRKYAFKCHRVKDDSGFERIYPVNAVAFHPLHNTFASGGSDGIVNVWDPFNKKRLTQFHKYVTSISSLCMSPDGSTIAIGVSYQHEFEHPPNPYPSDEVYIRKLGDHEVRPKSLQR